MMRILAFLFLLTSCLYSYPNKIDSLSSVFETVSENEKLETLRKIGFEYYDLGQSHSKIGNQNKAINYYNKALVVFQELGDKLNVASNLNEMGILYQEKGDYTKALDCYLQASKLIDELEIETKESSVMRPPLLNNIGVIYFRMNNINKAKEYFLKAYEIHERNNSKIGMAFSLNALGIVCFEEENNVKALEYYNQALNISKELDNKKEVSITINNLGVVYEKMNKYDQAIKHYEQVIELNKKQGNKMIISSCKVNIGLAKFKQNKIKEGINDCLEALKIAKKGNILNAEKEACSCLVKGYEQIGQEDLALKYYKQEILVKDSLYDKDKAKELTKMEMQYEFDKQQQIDSLRWEHEKSEQQIIINNQKKWILFSIFVAISILAFLIILFFQKRQTLFANDELVRRNLELVSSEKQLLITKKTLEEKVEGNRIQKIDGKYSASAISDEHKRELLDKIIDLMETQCMYRNSDFTVGKLADKLYTNKNYISQTLNIHLNKTFNNFINEYRIKEARKLLSDPSNRHITIEGISRQVGFNSKSVFNTAFKKHTGITPSFFLKAAMKSLD